MNVVRFLWKLQFYHLIFFGFSQVYPKCSEVNRQYRFFKKICSIYVIFLVLNESLHLRIYKSHMVVKNLVLELQLKMLLTNQIAFFSNFNISKTIWDRKFAFNMYQDIHESCSLTMKFFLGVVRHAWHAHRALKQINNISGKGCWV